MTHKEFMTQLKEYYGDYKQPGTGKMVYVYLVETFKENNIGWIFQRLLRTVSTQYNHVPDIATIEKTWKENPEILPTIKQAERKLLKKNADTLNKVLTGRA